MIENLLCEKYTIIFLFLQYKFAICIKNPLCKRLLLFLYIAFFHILQYNVIYSLVQIILVNDLQKRGNV